MEVFSGPDRSMYAGLNAPYEWGPGPWDYEEFSWGQRARMSGDLRSWSPGIPITGGPIVCKHGSAIETKGRYVALPESADDEDMLLSTCWCGEHPVRVPTEWVRDGWTASCGTITCRSELVYPEEST